MTTKKNLVNLSIFLLIFNLILGAFAIFTYFKAAEKQALKEIQQNTEILGVSDIPIFNPNRLMSDADFTSTRAFPDEASVQKYLDQVNSPLRNYTEQGRRASYWIFAAARGQTSSRWGIVPQLNPGLILAYLQKEQSLLTLSGYDTVNDPEFRLRAAMGYACPDGGSCNPNYRGFVNQVNWAAYQLQLNFNQATTNGGGTPYRVNQTISTLDEYNVFLSNAATAANYRYTPHVYWGNYNLWKIMTANGWGESSQTFSISSIDEVNLPLRNRPINTDPNERIIPLSEVYHLIIKNYTLGETSSDIGLLQRFLKQQGYFMRNDITSTFGVVTQNALFAFRRERGIILNEPSETCKQLIKRDFVFGTTSEEVRNLQQCLRDIGLFDFPTNTGYYGSITQQSHTRAKSAIENFGRIDLSNLGERCFSLISQNWAIGQTGNQVVELQNCLTAAGTFRHIHGSTGYFGPVTQKALEDFRQFLAQNPTTPPAQNPAPTNPSTSETNSNIPPSNQGVNSQPTKTTCEQLRDSQWTFGERSQRVRELQTCMTTAGFFNWPNGSTGYFGPVTQDALNRWRQATTSGANIPPSSTPANTCENLKKRGWVMGTRSEDVRKLQECMRIDGVFNWPAGNTGFFGEATRESFLRWRNQGTTCQELKNAGWIFEERSPNVVRLQECMRADGVFNWPAGNTGFFGDITRESLIRWRGYF